MTTTHTHLPTTISIAPAPGRAGTYTVHKNGRLVGWVEQLDNGYSAINIHGDEITMFASPAEAGTYIANEGAE